MADPRLISAARRLGRAFVKGVVVSTQQQARAGLLAPEDVIAKVLEVLAERSPGMRPVINASGVILHTNLGRAALSEAAAKALSVAAGYTNVEFDLNVGNRARRGQGTLDALAEVVPDAQAVHIVNNNASALLLAATVLARDREIIISRGELVEIGDGFRIPDLLTSTGARLREVGTTNRTSLEDYQRAIGDATGFVLKVHPSNFRIEGFTSDVGVDRLADLEAPVVVDVGSGLLRPDAALPGEPDVTTALRTGADLVTSSCDKLLGGPQAGLLLGRADLVERLRRHPLARAVRVDKLTLAALEATLQGSSTPTTDALHVDPAELYERARRIAAELTGHGVEACKITTVAVVGGGGAPGVPLSSVAVALSDRYSVPLRSGDPAIVGRIADGRLLLDLRAVPPHQDEAIIEAVLRASL